MPSYSQDDVVRWITGQADGRLDLTVDNPGLPERDAGTHSCDLVSRSSQTVLRHDLVEPGPE